MTQDRVMLDLGRDNVLAFTRFGCGYAEHGQYPIRSPLVK